MRRHDLVIIGSGSGNMVVDDSFSDLDVAIIEERRFGGTCVNYGCIPSKLLSYTAELADNIAGAADFDIDADLRRLRWAQVRNRVFTRTDDIAAQGQRGREDSDFVTVYTERAVFTGPKRLRVGDTEIEATQIVIAAGGRPAVPQVVSGSGVPYETSDTVMRIDTPPRRLAVLGGGYIAAELAHVFAAAGSAITIIEKNDLLLGGPQDDEIRTVFTDLMRARHDLRLGVDVGRISGTAGDLVVHCDDGSTVEADMLLVAAGRVPNTDRLAVAAAGIEVDDSGLIIVDEYGRTSADGVFALGDISVGIPLKHVANREADAVKHNLRHPDSLRTLDRDRVPSAVFTHPQMASVGITEEQARRDHPGYLVSTYSYDDVAYGWALQDSVGRCKVIADGATGQILGAHLIGAQAATLIQSFVIAMEFGIDAESLATKPYWIHPALTEVLQNALLNLAPA
ncbi:mycothione reductase [Mycolicibacterium tokaiense]|uniref:Mycothione reductase n=1 Tax=Mycolicibacterium tokaiense TaxID=39695 RepID=A0A378TF00_9MYCO|nr:mycothione reductase [Mycolicibacterium tokaiense]BBY86096.1 mycothione reductase [Mycolicibacterium tokaiense]STZ59391.1 mycothione reductase [Mycolicibacterium tokaiense]